MAVPAVAHPAGAREGRIAVKEPPGGGTVTRVQNGGMLTRRFTSGRESFEYHFEVWQIRSMVTPGTLEAEVEGAMRVPLSGPASLGEASGSLRTGVDLPFDLSVAKGSARLYLKDEKEVWLHIKAGTPYGAYDHNVHLFDLESGTATDKTTENKTAEDKAAENKAAEDKTVTDAQIKIGS
jgi:hypothetical protein